MLVVGTKRKRFRVMGEGIPEPPGPAAGFWYRDASGLRWAEQPATEPDIVWPFTGDENAFLRAWDMDSVNGRREWKAIKALIGRYVADDFYAIFTSEGAFSW